MKYSAPIVEIEVLNTADIVMVSNLEVQESGDFLTTEWGSTAWS